jgi:hypothetical protein
MCANSNYGLVVKGNADSPTDDTPRLKASPRARRGRFFGIGLAFFRFLTGLPLNLAGERLLS